jgi:hypothetical protein
MSAEDIQNSVKAKEFSLSPFHSNDLPWVLIQQPKNPFILFFQRNDVETTSRKDKKKKERRTDLRLIHNEAEVSF